MQTSLLHALAIAEAEQDTSMLQDTPPPARVRMTVKNQLYSPAMHDPIAGMPFCAKSKAVVASWSWPHSYVRQGQQQLD